jgi:hypothetical protein
MRRDYTGYHDAEGNMIYTNTQVQFEGEVFDVDLNPFNNRYVIDNDNGIARLSDVHDRCTVVK